MRAVCRCTGLLEVVTAEGFAVTLDPEPLTALDELLACMAGRHTFTRHDIAGSVHGRTPFAIRTRPAGSRPRQTVLAEHRCDPGSRTRGGGTPTPGSPRTPGSTSTPGSSTRGGSTGEGGSR